MSKESSQEYLLKKGSSRGIMIHFQQIVLETGYALVEPGQAIQNMLILQALSMDIKTLRYFSMHVLLTVFIARTGTSERIP